MASATPRILKAIGESGLWKPIGRLHAWLYRTTGGRIGHRAGHITHLLLTTTGRKSGEPRTVTLTYMAEGDNYILVASNGGADRHPVWWLNLKKNPRAQVQVGKELRGRGGRGGWYRPRTAVVEAEGVQSVLRTVRADHGSPYPGGHLASGRFGEGLIRRGAQPEGVALYDCGRGG